MITKLQNACDFPQWKRRIMALLQDKDYDVCINYDFNTFNPLDIPPSAKCDEKSRIDMKAKGLIELNVGDSVLQHLVSEPTAHAYWVKLHALYQRKSLSSVVCSLRSLLFCTQSGKPTQEYVGSIEQRIRDLNSVGINLPDNLVAAFIMCNLDSRFANVATALDSHDIETLSITKITALLMNEEARQDQEPSTFQANVTLKHRQRLGKCRIHPFLAHTNEECYSQHPELRPADWTPKARHYNFDKQNHANLSSYYSACKASIDRSLEKSPVWHIDTGCSNHMTFDRTCLKNYTSSDQNETVQLGDNTLIQSSGKGECSLQAGSTTVRLKDVLAVPDLGKNLFSPGQAAATGLKFLISDDFMTIYSKDDFAAPSGNVIAQIRKSPDNLYRFDRDSVIDCSDRHHTAFAIRHNVPLPISKWHARLAHTNHTDIIALSKVASHGVKIKDVNDKPNVCEPCIYGKMTRRPFTLRISATKAPGDLIVSDVMGPFSTRGIGGHRYFVTYTDHFTRFCTVAVLHRKSEQLYNLKLFEAAFCNQHQVTIKQLQSDNGGEYLSLDVRNWLQDKGIHHRRTVPGDSESNGLAERMNRTLTDMALSMLAQSRLPEKCFPWAILTAVHIYNRRPHSCLPNQVTPYEALYKIQPNLHYLRIFGCVAYRHIHDHNRKKTQFRAQKLIHIGYTTNQKAYRLYDPINDQIIASRDVEFDENAFDYGFDRDKYCIQLGDTSEENLSHELNSHESTRLQDTEINPEEHDISSALEPDGEVYDDGTKDSEEDNIPVSLRRSTRESRPPTEWWKVLSANEANILTCGKSAQFPRPDLSGIKSSTVLLPSNASAALQGPYAGHWFDALEKEYEQMENFKTWDLQDLPMGRKAISCKWVFDIKPSLNGDGSVRKFKARLVIKGFSQRAGIDYNETFSPVAHHESFRIILAIAAQHALYLRQIDIVGAFLNGKIDDEIYMNQPEGFIVKGQENKVCRLNKALYGLKQAGMIWNQNLDDFLRTVLNFQQTRADPCVYVYKKLQSMVILGVYVDDILLAHNDEALCDTIVGKFATKWDITDLGCPARLLGMQISRKNDNGAVGLSQRAYVEELLSKFNMINCKSSPTPHQSGFYLTSKMSPSVESEMLEMRNVPYAELVGSLNWLSTNTRPDIATSVGTLCRFISNPGRQHWNAALRVLRYLSGTLDHGIYYQQQEQNSSLLLGYSDADWAGEPDTRRSTTGYVFTLAGGPIAWKSKLQKSSALSSVEAEYIAACSASREAKWIRQLLNEIGFPAESPTTICEDNQGCISISNNNRTDSRTKHIDVKYHFVRDMVKSKEIQLMYISTEHMLADFLTKPINSSKFQWCSAKLIRDIGTNLRGRAEIQPAANLCTDQEIDTVAPSYRSAYSERLLHTGENILDLTSSSQSVKTRTQATTLV
jgi:transposase InsO family protein